MRLFVTFLQKTCSQWILLMTNLSPDILHLIGRPYQQVQQQTWWQGETVSTETIKRDWQLFHHDWSLNISTKHASLQEYEMTSCHEKTGPPRKIVLRGKLLPAIIGTANKNRPPPNASATYIYIASGYITRGEACAERWIPACLPSTICLYLVMK